MVNAKPRPLYPRERHGTHCIGDWVGLRAGLDRCGKSRPHRDFILGPSSPLRVAIPTTLSRLLLALDYLCKYWIYVCSAQMTKATGTNAFGKSAEYASTKHTFSSNWISGCVSNITLRSAVHLKTWSLVIQKLKCFHSLEFQCTHQSSVSMFPHISASSSSCSWRVRRVSCSLILKMKLVPPSLSRSSYVPSSFRFIL